MITECPYCGYDGLEYTGIDDDAGDYAGQPADVYECVNCGAIVVFSIDEGICAADDGVIDDDDDDDSGQDWLFAAYARAAAAGQRDMLDLEIGYQEGQEKRADTGIDDFPF